MPNPCVLRVTICLCVCLGMQCTNQAQCEHELLRRFEKASSADIAAKLCQIIFDTGSDEGLSASQLINCECPGIAIQSAWRLHHRSLPPKKVVFGVTPNVLYLPDVQRFVGFVEGRLRVQVPEWWEEMLESPDRNQPLRLGAPVKKWRPFDRSQIAIDSKLVELQTSTGIRSAPIEAFNWIFSSSGTNEYAATSANRDTLVVSKPIMGSKARILCVSADGMERWRNELWGTHQWTGGTSGAPVTPVEVVDFVASNEVITIFGASSLKHEHSRGTTFIRSAFYIEQFSTRDGSSLMRFSTNNWGMSSGDQ